MTTGIHRHDTWSRARDQQPQAVNNSRYYRAACREIARSTDERTAIAAILPPGVLCSHTISVERKPSGSSNARAVRGQRDEQFPVRLDAAAEGSGPRQPVYSRRPAEPASCAEADRFLAHGALRLCSNLQGFCHFGENSLVTQRRQVHGRPSQPRTIAQQLTSKDAVVAHAYRTRSRRLSTSGQFQPQVVPCGATAVPDSIRRDCQHGSCRVLSSPRSV